MTLREWLALNDEINRHMLPYDVQQAIDAHRPIADLLNSEGWGGGGGKPEPLETPLSHPGVTVREEREKLCWTQAKLAKKAGCSLRTITSLECQKAVPGEKILSDIQTALRKA